MTRYAKTVIAVIGAISVWGVTACAADGVSMAEWFGLLGALGTSLGVYFLPNAAPGGAPPKPGIGEDPQPA
jgi:hypothetical protein